MYVTALLDFSRDPLSDTTPAWTDVTPYLLEARWAAGVQKEGDEPQPGQATFVLDNRTRRFEPDYAAGAYYPDIVDMRRFRWRVQNGIGSGTIYNEGVWYAADWAQDWGTSDMFQKAVVAAGDGSSVLSLDDLPQMDPPDAQSLSDVIGFDEPSIYYTLGDPAGTRAKPHVVYGRKTVGSGKSKHRRKFKRRRGTEYSTRSEAGAVAGPAGTYKGNPILGEPSLVVGDSEPSVRFDGVNDWVKVVLEDAADLIDGNQITVGALVKPATVSGTDAIIGGPDQSAGSCFYLKRETTGYAFGVVASGPVTVSAAGGTAAADTIAHVVGTWDGTTVILYVNGTEVARSTGSIVMAGTGSLMGVGVIAPSSPTQFWEGWIAHPFVCEFALRAERVLAHYQAARLRGWPEQTAGTRIADIATHALWAETSIQTTGRDVQPMFQHGQPRMDEVAELAHAEGPQTAFFFNGTGDPVYRGHEWQATAAAYNTVQATFGNQTGEVPYEDIELVNDNETFNDITVSHESGDLVQVTDSTSIGQRGRRANSEWTDVLLAEHNHVESLADHLLAFYKDPQFRPARLILNGDHPDARTQIFERQIGHLIRIKHRPAGGTAIDRVCHILGYEKSLEAETGQLRCTWNLARGFNASLDGGQWHAGIVGFSEAGTTTNTG